MTDFRCVAVCRSLLRLSAPLLRQRSNFAALKHRFMHASLHAEEPSVFSCSSKYNYIYKTNYITKESTIMQGSKLDSSDNSLDLKAAEVWGRLFLRVIMQERKLEKGKNGFATAGRLVCSSIWGLIVSCSSHTDKVIVTRGYAPRPPPVISLRWTLLIFT